MSDGLVKFGERSICDCALAFLAMSGDSTNTIDRCLGLLGQAVSATRVVLFELVEDNTCGDATYEWHHPERSPQRGARYKDSELPEAFAVFNRGDTVVATIEGGHDYLGLQANMAEEELALLVITPIRRDGRTAWASVFSWHGSASNHGDIRVAFCERATAVLGAGLARAQEIQERATQEAKLLHSRRLESIGLLAGGIAHDFNNVLQAVLGLSELLRLNQESEGDIKVIDELIDVAQRASQITGRLLVFSRQEVRERRSLDVVASLASVTEFLKRSIPEDRQIKLSLDCPPVQVGLAPTDFEHAIINLSNNASAAMPKGGVIEVGCRALASQGSVEVWVRDNGAGMTAEQLRQARDPFFTTKPVGEGTGLGLTMVDTMVQQVGGSLQIDSVEGEGTRVGMIIPTIDAEDKPAQLPSGAPVKGTETVLVAEDDPVILRVTCSHLERAGFTPLPATNGKDAVALFRKHQAEIKMVIADAIMPNGGGAELYDDIVKEKPSLPFLFVTGYDAGTLSKETVDQPNCTLIQKPYQAEALLSRVREMIDRKTGD